MDVREVEIAQALAVEGAHLELVTRTGSCPWKTFEAHQDDVQFLAGRGWKINLV